MTPPEIPDSLLPMPKSQKLVRLTLLLLAIGVGFWLLWRSASPQPTSFPLPIPATAKLLSSFHHEGAIREHTYAFVFEVTDDELLNQLIDEWSLEDHSSDHFSGSFAATTAKAWKVKWWPSREELEAMPRRFELYDHSRQFYHAVYCGREPDRLYVEYGNW